MTIKDRPKVRVVYNVQKEINPHFKPVWTSNYPNNILKGGRNSFKSSVISMKLVRDMLMMINDGHKANVVILRKVASTLRDTVFQQVQWAIRKFGVEHLFIVRVTPYTITHRATGSTFYFYGQDDVEKIKGNAINDIMAVWYEEATEFGGQEDFDQNFATFARQKSPHKDYVQFFWSYNPPRNPFSWINEWSENIKESPDYLVHESTYLDDELDFVTDQMLNEINRIKKNDYDYYRYLYLGEAVGLGMNVYNFELFNKLDRLPKGEYIKTLNYGLDTGHQQSATACLCVGITNKNNVILLDTYYYDPSGKVRKLAPDELSANIYEFERKTRERFDRPVGKRTIDSAEGAIRNQYYKDFGIRWNPVNKGKKVDLIDNVITLLAQGRVYYLDTARNEIFIEQHKNYRWEEKTVETDNPTVVQDEDHTPDAWQYFVNDNLRELDLVW